MASKMAQAVRKVQDDKQVVEFIRYSYWSKHSLKCSQMDSFKSKADEAYSNLSEGQKARASEALRILNSKR